MFAPLFLLCSDDLLLAPTNFVEDIHEEDDEEAGDDAEDATGGNDPGQHDQHAEGRCNVLR